jgi:hypothetical protein
LIGGCALAELSLLAVGFVYLYHPPSGRMLERRFKSAGAGARFSQTPDEGVASCARRNRLRLENSATPLEKRLLVQPTTAPASTPASAKRSRPSSR